MSLLPVHDVVIIERAYWVLQQHKPFHKKKQKWFNASYIILEARDHPGGCTLFPVPIDFSTHWVHTFWFNPLVKLALHHRVELYPVLRLFLLWERMRREIWCSIFSMQPIDTGDWRVGLPCCSFHFLHFPLPFCLSCRALAVTWNIRSTPHSAHLGPLVSVLLIFYVPCQTHNPYIFFSILPSIHRSWILLFWVGNSFKTVSLTAIIKQGHGVVMSLIKKSTS